MSEFLASAAEKTGVPEELIERAAAARAEASGSSTDDVLRAWAGGESAPVTAVAAEPAADEPPAEDETATPTATAPAEAPAVMAEAPVQTVEPTGRPASREAAAPVLVGRRDNPMLLLAGAVAVLLLGAVFGVLLPSGEIAAARAEAVPGTTIEYSTTALDGRDVYVQEGCWYCHTQQVRPIVTDAGLGRVTSAALIAAEKSDTLGFQRIGPDLANVAARQPFNDPATIVAYLRNPESVVEGSRQPAYAHLSAADLESLAQYLVETSEPYSPDADE